MKTDSIIVNLPKNIVQYLIGFSLYLLVYGSFDPLKLVLGLASFIITYSAIYPYNDLMDYENDKKDKFKKVYKALVRGDLKPKTAITMAFGMPIIGLMLASLISTNYMMLLMTILLQNFLHSSPYTSKTFKNKKRYMIPNMFIMQSIKFTLGWFTFTTDLTRMPIWIITTLSSAYILGYWLYKTNMRNLKGAMQKNLHVMIPLSALTITAYVISIIIYPYRLPLIIIFPLLFLFLTMKRQKNVVKKTFTMSNFTVLVLGAIAFMLLLLNVPVIAEVNEGTTEVFDKISNITLKQMDNETYNIICQINNSLYSYPLKDLKELNDIFNLSTKEVIVRNETI